jgi:hypothetical protein
MAVTTGTVSPLLTEGIRKLVGDEFKRYPLEFAQYLNMNTSRKNFEFDREVTTIGMLAPKAENAAIVLSDPRVGREKRYTMTTFAGGIRTSWEAKMDELYGFINRQFRGLGKAANEIMNVEGAQVFNLANDGTAGALTGFDTLELWHGTHTGPDGEAISYADNQLALDLSESALQTALIQFEDVRDAQDNRMMMSPRKLIYARDSLFLVKEILQSEGKPFTGDNTTNVLKGILTPIMLHYGDSDLDAWQIQADGHDLNWFMRTPPVLRSYDDDSSLSTVSTIATRFTRGFGDWRHVIGSPGV